MARYRIWKDLRYDSFHDCKIVSYFVQGEFYAKPDLATAIRAKRRLIQMDKERKNNG